MITPPIDNKVLVPSASVVANPPDLTGTWDRIRIYGASATSVSAGAYSVTAATASIVSTTTTTESPGYTELAWSNSDVTSNWFLKATYYHSSATNPESVQTDRPIQGSTTRLEDQLAVKLRDTDNAVWSTAEKRDYSEKAVESLFPHLSMNVVDSSLSTAQDTRSYTLPVGIFKVNRAFIGSLSDGTYRENSDYEIVDERTLKFNWTPSQAETITLEANRRFRHSWEVPLVYEDILLYYAQYLAYQALESDRGKFKQFAELVADKDIRVVEISQMANTFLRRWEKRISELTKWEPTERALV